MTQYPCRSLKYTKKKQQQNNKNKNKDLQCPDKKIFF